MVDGAGRLAWKGGGGDFKEIDRVLDDVLAGTYDAVVDSVRIEGYRQGLAHLTSLAQTSASSELVAAAFQLAGAFPEKAESIHLLAFRGLLELDEHAASGYLHSVVGEGLCAG